MKPLLATLPVFLLVLLLSVATAQIYNPAINLVSGKLTVTEEVELLGVDNQRYELYNLKLLT